MELFLRLGLFALVFLLVALAEYYHPRRPRQTNWHRRWASNLGLLLVDIMLQRFTVGAVAIVTAIYAQQQGWGLLTLVPWPWISKALVSFLVLDFAIYIQHVLSHKLPLFWRLHQVHHADLDMDVTTAVRFHPIEILLSALYKAVIVAAFGIDPWVVLAFEIVLNASALFNHGNLALPAPLDRVLRHLIVTPDMHRIHHSVIPQETDSNYGFFLSIWDRLCGTSRATPQQGQMNMEIGLAKVRTAQETHFWQALLMPFRKPES